MTKQDVIKVAYGEHFEKVKYLIDENGVLHRKVIGHSETNNLGYANFGFHFGEIEIVHDNHSGNYKWRPKSLRGIENNNGWIKIESEDDLPKTEGDYLVFYEGSICTISIYGSLNIQEIKYWIKFYTHYQPIEKPKPPLY